MNKLVKIINNGLPEDIKLQDLNLGTVVLVEWPNGEKEAVIIILEPPKGRYTGRCVLKGLTPKGKSAVFSTSQVLKVFTGISILELLSEITELEKLGCPDNCSFDYTI